MMSVDDTLMCSFQILKPADKKAPGAVGGSTGARYQMSPGVGAAPLNYSGAAGAGAAGGVGAGGAGQGGGAAGSQQGSRPSTPPKGGPPPKGAVGPKK